MSPCMHPSLPPLQRRPSPGAACNHAPAESAAVAAGTAVVTALVHRLPAMSCTGCWFSRNQLDFNAHILGEVVIPCFSTLYSML